MAVETLRLTAFVLMFFMAPTPDAPEGGPARAGLPCVAPPQVLRAAPNFARTIDQMWRRSPTFRRQVARLAAGGLLVTIERCSSVCPDTVRAQTTVTYRDGEMVRVKVRLQLRPFEEPELIAHELEHVVEQLDGVNLPRIASRGSSLVNVNQAGRYETARAHRIGRIAAAEHRAGVEISSGCERRMP